MTVAVPIAVAGVAVAVAVVAVSVVPVSVVSVAVVAVPVAVRQGAGPIGRGTGLLHDRQVFRRPSIREPGHPMVMRPSRAPRGETRGSTSLTGHLSDYPLSLNVRGKGLGLAHLPASG